jgi:hypothetical protein
MKIVISPDKKERGRPHSRRENANSVREGRGSYGHARIQQAEKFPGTPQFSQAFS